MKKPKAAAAAAVLLASLLGGPASADPGAPWVRVQEKEYGFQVTMPEQPEEVMTRKDYGVGEVINHVYTARENQQVFKVDYSQLPDLAVSFLGEPDILDKTRSGILQRFLARQTSWEDTTLGKLKGKKLTFATAPAGGRPGMKGEAVIFLKGRRLYVAETVLPQSQLPGSSDRFFQSFQID